jgi:hypothetical protein
VEWASIQAMGQEVRESVWTGYRHCYASCCHDLQTQEQHRQHALLQKLERYRNQAIEAQDESQANAAFVNLNIVAAALHHLQLWLLIKADRMEEAWDQLVEAQDSMLCALRFVTNDFLDHWYLELLALERLLFPPQQFVSDSHYWDYAICGICEKVYGDCGHVAGCLYMGQMCVKRPHQIIGVNHVALVEHPRDKGCRVTKFKRDGFMHCTLTYRELEKADGKRGNIEACILRAR